MKVKRNDKIEDIQSLWFNEPNKLYMIDQRLLPFTFQIFEATKVSEVCTAIKEMVVRGAPLIGVTAAYGLVISAANFRGNDYTNFKDKLKTDMKALESTRPTAVDLFNNLKNMIESLNDKLSIEENKKLLLQKAHQLSDRTLKECKLIGKIGCKLITDKVKNIMTICNAGALATVDIGTALAPIREVKKQGKDITVLVPETRPRMQGGRLTAWELYQEDIEHFIITDNTIGYFFSQNLVDLVIVGADRIVRNGDVANKIGTYTLSLLCKNHNVPFYIAAPLSTFDISTDSGKDVIIERRDENEVRMAMTFDETTKTIEKRIIHHRYSENRNIAFDITPAENITGIITPKGIIKANEEEIMKLLQK